MSTVSTPSLDTIRVVGDRIVRGRLEEFETRRLNRQATVSISREDIVKRNPSEIWQMLTGVPSIKVVDGFNINHAGDNIVVAVSARDDNDVRRGRNSQAAQRRQKVICNQPDLFVGEFIARGEVRAVVNHCDLEIKKSSCLGNGLPDVAAATNEQFQRWARNFK